MVAGPEIARAVNEFESAYEVQKRANTCHHEQVSSVQKAFAKDVQNLIEVIDEMGNPFREDSTDLIVLDTKEIVPKSVVEAVSAARRRDSQCMTRMSRSDLLSGPKAITDTIQLCNLPLFGTQEKKAIKLYIACQAREGNLEEFFKHENSPPALSCNGKMRTGQKSELIACVEVNTTLERPAVDVVVLDGAAIVNMLSPGKCKTFKEYADTVFISYVISYRAQNVKRIDLVWDRYLKNSLKQGTREARGTGDRRRVCDNAAIPLNWKSFLRLDDNKKDLF
ncbi:hypothetical protein ACROYT_G040524 [Oculina patagonica]